MAAQSPADTRMTGMLHSHHKGGDDGPGGDAVHPDVRVRQALPAAHRLMVEPGATQDITAVGR